MTTLQEALPCPFCGKQHTLQVISGQELMGEDQEFWQHSESFGVVCDASTPDGKGGCGATGGFKPTEDEAIEAWNTRSALAQQGEQQPVAWYEYNQDLDAWFLAYGHNPKAKTRPLVFGDTAAPAPQPAQEPVLGTKTWFDGEKVITQNLTASDIYAEPAPQPVHQGERAELIRRLYAIANTEANEVADALNEAADMLQSAQPVALPNHSEQHLYMVAQPADEALLRLALEVLLPYKSNALRWYTPVDAAIESIRARLESV